MRVTLRLQIILFTVLPLMALVVATLATVDRSITAEVEHNLVTDLERASAVFENMLAKRSESLRTAGRVIVEDPRFFSALTLPGSYRDEQLRGTVAGVAREFEQITQTDLFEVFDARGHQLATVGGEVADAGLQDQFVHAALAGRQQSGVLAVPGRHYQVAAIPVYVAGRIVGVLLLGEEIGRDLANELRALTRSEVTFLAGPLVTGSTLEDAADRDSLIASLGATGRAAADGAVRRVRGRDHVYLTLLSRLPDSEPGADQRYAMQRSLDVETAFLRQVQQHLLALGAAAFVLSLLIGLLVSERIVSPVRRLVRGAEEMERGNYDYPLGADTRNEIGYLAQRFGVMRQRQRMYVQSLEEVARLKSEFVAVASHELRTPLSIIRGYHELLALERMGPLTSPQREALTAIERSLVALDRIAENATRVAQIEGARLELRVAEHDLDGLLRRATDQVRREAKGRAVDIASATDGSGRSVWVDGTRLTEAIANLVRNGVRFTPDGGRVEVRARWDGEVLMLEVEDTGVGIPEEERNALFERPYLIRDSMNHHSSGSLEFNSGGLGLGLAIARGIVELHGGSIEVWSEVGRGTRFRIRLPQDNVARSEAA